jgi:flavodoxin
MTFLLSISTIFCFASCEKTPNDVNDENSEDTTDTVNTVQSQVLVVYFSCTGTTKRLAEYAADILGADIYEIVPETPYTSADLNYSNNDCRANREQNTPSARPAIKNGVENMEKYDVILLGYPIWWGQAPKIIYTFLDTYDFRTKRLFRSALPTVAVLVPAIRIYTRLHPKQIGCPASDFQATKVKPAYRSGLKV